MKILKTFETILSSILGKWFTFLGTLTGFIGLYISFQNDKNAVIAALLFFCLMLIIFTSVLVYSLLRLLEFRNKDFLSRSTFMKYETTDGSKIIFENYKVLQAKKPVLTEFEYGFKWTGTHLPVITSAFQDVINIVDVNDPTNYDKAILKFRKPLYYNQNQVVHFKAELNDADKRSSTHLESKVLQEVDIIHFRVILKHAPSRYSSNAIIQRRKINTNVNAQYEEIEQIAFCKITKSYEYHLVNPEINYFYRIIWTRV